jgi:hypothetical protein
VVRPGIDLALRVRARETWHTVRGRVFKQLEGFDPRFDDLWQRLAPSFPIAGERTHNFLRWRYVDCPLQRHFILALLSPDESAVSAYATCYVGTKQQLQIVDILADPASPGLLDDLVCSVLRWARSHGAASVAIELLGAGPTATVLEPSLERFGFVDRAPTDSLALLAKDQSTPSSADYASSFYFLRGDESYNTM